MNYEIWQHKESGERWVIACEAGGNQPRATYGPYPHDEEDQILEDLSGLDWDKDIEWLRPDEFRLVRREA